MGKPVKLRIVFVLALLAAQFGCISRTRAVPMDQRLLPAETSTRAELIRSLQVKSGQIQTLQGTMSLDVSGGGLTGDEITEYRQTRGVVVIERPKQILFKVQAPIVGTTIATMVSDGQEYRVSVPLKNRFVVGDENIPTREKTAILNLKPQHIVRALFVDVTSYLNDPQVKPLFEEATLGTRRFYVFSFVNIAGQDVRLLERLWIDRTQHLQVSRKQIYNQEGKVEMDVEYLEYRSDNGIDFPNGIVIQRPIEDFTLKMTFTKATVNEKVMESAFVLERPPGSELVQPKTEAETRQR